ncbi:MAG: PEP-CTERM sorting domain-containing protein [Bryobacteraceae bacterium]|nr:PEP-CTERM sorting domain-containing protein [Bryobacteraceae bacterium]
MTSGTGFDIVPEPATAGIAAAALGLGALAARRRRS